MPVSFEPIYDNNSTVLILGSFPSVKSREVSFYYGHPRNRFWTVLGKVLEIEIDLYKCDTDGKRRMLLDNRIALWDVVHSCDINGSSDASIKNVIPNDILFLLKNTNIKCIYCNGATSKKLYDRYIYPQTGVRAVALPSTSPANAKYSLDTLVGIWKRISIVLNRTDYSKRYYSLNSFAHDNFGHKLYKLSLDGGFTCPNRDGKLDTRGCIFCDGEGSGHFAGKKEDNNTTYDISEQISFQKELIKKKTDKKQVGYIAYFQAYTGTYASIEILREKYMQAISDPEVEIISIATRPDCLGNEVIELLREINAIKPVWIELGLQTINPDTAELIRRGYGLDVYDNAVISLLTAGISHIITHVILGLPGESDKHMLQTVEYVCRSGAQGIKLQLLHVIRGTDLETMYKNNEFNVLTMEEYMDILDKCMDVIPADMVVHRLSGDGNKQTLIAPLWSGDKKRVINEINRISKIKPL